MSWIVFIVIAIVTCSLTFLFVRRWSESREDEPDSPARARAPRAAARQAVPSAPRGAFTSMKGTQDVGRACPNHDDEAATWTCRFCKKDYCERCSRKTGGERHCPSPRCIESARAFAAARKGA